MGSSYHRSLCQPHQLPATSIQLSALGPFHSRHRCSCPEQLEYPKQFCKCTIQLTSPDSRQDCGHQSSSHSYCTNVARQAMVPTAVPVGNRSPSTAAISQGRDLVGRSTTRTASKPQMEDLRLEALWRGRLVEQNWSEQAIVRFLEGWAPKTRQVYNASLNKCYGFCIKNGYGFPPSVSHLAEYICHLGKESCAPKAQLHTLLAALSSLYSALHVHDITRDIEISQLIKGTIKVDTSVPAKKSLVMPIAPFRQLLYSFGDNVSMSIKFLRLKTITTLALLCMLRPSDIAPHSVHRHGDGNELRRRVFSAEHVTFDADLRSVSIVFMGIKNDTDRSGFQVKLPASQDKYLDPVAALKTYMDRTDTTRRSTPDKPVFLPLRPPYSALSADTIGNILEQAIGLAGLAHKGYSAKCFRPTGATYAIQLGYDAEVVMKMGRWKTRSVFFEHYVHSQVPESYSSRIMMGL